MLVPFTYNLRSLLVRRASTLLTVLGIGAVVAAVSGVLALQQGFETLHSQNGREDIAVFLRPGASSEGVSGVAIVSAAAARTRAIARPLPRRICRSSMVRAGERGA